ncbi:MAG: GFA family protein [Rhizobiaceae bacterium]|nr:GFA family protein [Rhizobiaceae bacterium]
MTKMNGSCRCGAVRYEVTGHPKRVGICHCTDCRQESGSAFTFYAVWPASAFVTTGETDQYEGRSFCPKCGSRLFSQDSEEAEIKLGTLESAPTELVPTYELWIKRRERWLPPIPGAQQFDQDRV